MDKITQEAYFRQRVLKYALEHGVLKCQTFAMAGGWRIEKSCLKLLLSHFRNTF